MASYNFEVKYRAGKENTNTDALSRFPTTLAPPKKAACKTTGISALAVTANGPNNTLGALSEEWEAAKKGGPGNSG